MSAPMVRAILDGSKTQTRRVVKPQPPHDPKQIWWACPYGQPGDRLWVRESTHARPLTNLLTGEPTNAICAAYSADDASVLDDRGFDLAWWYSRKSCPSIHMPRWASRITLEITGVRVERLRGISRADAVAEGIEPELGTAHWKNYDTSPGGWRYWECPIQSYRTLWESINGPSSWDANPFCWVISFRRLDA